MEIAALIVSIVALAVSGASVAYARKQSHAQTLATQIEVDRRRDELEARHAETDRQRRATLDVRLAPQERNTRDCLLVSNSGPAMAEGISVSFVRPLSGDGGRDGAFDVIEARRYELPAGASERIRLTPDSESASLYEVALRWSDPAGDHEITRVINHGPF